MTDDPRIDALASTSILTDTHFRLTFAPQREEARVVALSVLARKSKMDALAALAQLGLVHIQIKAGFAPERKIVLTPGEVALLYDLLDKFVQELVVVDRKNPLATR